MINARTYMKRDNYIDRLIHTMWNGEIKVLTGIRRCGKSVILFELFYAYLLAQGVEESHIIKISLDQRRYSKYRNPITLCEYVESIICDKPKEQYYLFVDEVQFTTSVVDEENGGIPVTIYDMLNELKAYDNLDVYVTGSNSKGLSKDIATEFRGRATQIHVYPLSFAEFYAAVGGDERKALSMRGEKIHSALVSNYITHTKDSFLISMVKRYDIKGKSYFEYPNKYYYVDVGLRNARLNYRQFDPGHIMENIIYIELLRRGYSVDVGVVTDRTARKNTQREIDFVVNDMDRKIYIQSAFQMENDRKVSSEKASLMLTKDFFKKIIVRLDIPHHFYDEDGIFHCNLIDLLLGRVELF